jgi:hypothetical protein
MATIRRNCGLEDPPVTAMHPFTRLCFALALCAALLPARSNAQWWKHAPRDFEECAESAGRTATSKETRASLMSECDAKFAGRRKPGGGYSYYDFMQDRHFDIAGPNPTPEELRQIDEHYTEFLDRRKRSIIAAALMEKQQQQAEAELAKQVQPPAKKIPIPVSRPPVRDKTADCHDHSISCGWSRFAAKIHSIRKTLLGPTKKTNHG